METSNNILGRGVSPHETLGWENHCQTAFSVSNMWLPDMLWHGWPFGNQTCQLEIFHLHHLHIHMKELPLCLGIYQPATFDDHMISEGHLPKKSDTRVTALSCPTSMGGSSEFQRHPWGQIHKLMVHFPQLKDLKGATTWRFERKFGDESQDLSSKYPPVL